MIKKFLLAACLFFSTVAVDSLLSDDMLSVDLRTRVETEDGSGRHHTLTRTARWDPSKTAIVVCDMWDDHYCRLAASRVAEMAPRMNDVLAVARRRGVLVVHSPSGCMDQYEGTPQRELARQAPAVKTAVPLKGWCYLDGDHEAEMPVGTKTPCDDESPRQSKRFFTKQIDTLEIREGDAITDSAEAFYLMRQRGIENVIIMGVHTNMCVLGRPFGIRQLVYQGQNVALMRDMTDSMYNPREQPFVNHFTGNDLVFEHIEKHWCPTLTSADFLGGKPFRFPADRRPHLVVVMAEREYHTNETLPAFAREELGKDFRVSLVFASATDRNDLPGIEVLDDADIVLLSIRRRTLPIDQLAVVRRFIDAGKPLVGIRTTSHAFCLRGKKPAAGLAQWPDFDRQVLGGFYQNHHGNKLETRVWAAPGVQKHPIMKGVRSEEFRVFGSLYRSHPLAKTATPLLLGRAGKIEDHEPVAWTNIRPGGARVFYTSLGHREDFKIEAFRRLLLNGIHWAAGR